MKICAIVAEYDPLHNGHIYHLRQVRKLYDAVIILMSGHTTQRGEVSRYDKWSRAKAALLYGADLVFELPTIFSCSCAERFATGAITLLSNLSVVDAISFGSESGDIQLLTKVARKCLNIEQKPQFKALLKQGFNYPSARCLVLNEHSSLLKSPNNILGIEYIKAALKLNANLSFHTVKRIGPSHNDTSSNLSELSPFVNSTFLRKNPSMMNSFLPNDLLNLFNCPSSVDEKIFLFKLRNMSVHDFKALLDVEEGLENRLYSAALSATSLDDFISRVKTKRYTYSRIKRIVLYCMLNLQKRDILNPNIYARILGFTPNGRRILKLIKDNSRLFVTPDFKKIYKYFPDTAKFDLLSTNLFFLSFSPPKPCGIDFTTPIITIKNPDYYEF